jgi:hypothetical protein
LPLVGAVIVATALLPASAPAATIRVNDQADAYGTGGGCSLREALASAQTNADFGGCTAGSGADTIIVPAGTYVLTRGPAGDDAGAHGDLDVVGDTTIVGAGAGSTTIDGGGIDRVLDGRPSSRLELRGVTITGGHAPDGANGAAGIPGSSGTSGAPNGGSSLGGQGGSGQNGGGIRAAAALIVADALVSGNRAGSGGNGGASAAGGSGHRGGSASGSGGDSTGGSGGEGGTGGGIYALGPLTVERSRVTGNAAGDGGSGDDAGPAGNGSTPSCPDCNGGHGGASEGGRGGSGGRGGGIYAQAPADIADTVVAQNKGGDGGDGGDGASAGRGGDAATLTNPPSPASFGLGGGKGGYSTGGPGGHAGGGGIIAAGSTTIRNTSVTDNRAGAGGQGGDAGTAGDGGVGNDTRGGDGGAGGFSDGGNGGRSEDAGGADLFTPFVTGQSHAISASTIARNTAGHGGDGGNGAAAGRGGDGTPVGEHGTTLGGMGGGAGSGALLLGDPTVVSNTTIAANVGGQGGNGGNGGSATGFAENEGGDAGNAGVAGGAQFLYPSSVRHATISGNELGPPGVGGEPGPGGTRSAGVNGDTGKAGGVAGRTNLVNSVLAHNAAPNCDLVAPIDVGGNVSFPDASCPGVNADPKLGPLRDNGGPTETMSLGAGSPALDLPPASGPDCQPADQRGVARPQGAACDSGAYEHQAPVAVTGDALDVGPSGARLTGLATPNTGGASYRFEFGPAPAYGSRTESRLVGPDPAQASEAIGGLSPGTTYHYRLVVTTDGGTTAGEDRTFTTAGEDRTSTTGQAPSTFPPLSPGGQIPADLEVPAFTARPRVRPSAFEANPRRGPSLLTRAAVGARIRFVLSEPARVTFRVLKPARGRVRRGRCEKPSRRNRNGRRCTRYVALRGSFAHQAAAGLNQPRFSGRLRNRALKPGSYRLAATATDAARNKSAPANANFKIKRRKR